MEVPNPNLEPQNTDLEVKFHGTTRRVHRNILSSKSLYFKDKFRNLKPEDVSIEINDYDAEFILRLIDYCYGNTTGVFTR